MIVLDSPVTGARDGRAVRESAMNKLTKTLLGGVALAALTTAPAMAQQKHPGFHYMALHGGRVVNKTKMPNRGATHITYTFGIYTYASFSQAYRQKVHLQSTFYLNSNSSICNPNRRHFRVDQKKTEYGRTSLGKETYSFGCPSGPTTIYGMDYKITDPDAEGHTDHAEATYKARFTNSGTKYKGTLNLDVSIQID